MKEKTLAQTGLHENCREKDRKMAALLREGTALLQKAGIEEAPLDAWLLLEYVSGITRAVYYMDPDRELPEDDVRRYREALGKRAQRIPLQHITGVQEFMGYSFHVNEHVLIPRQDTEMLVECALQKLRAGMKVLDLCTGSGCIAASLYLIGRNQGKVSSESRFTASDISEEALKTAKENLEDLKADVRLVKSDLFADIKDRYDMIVSNPPYIRTGVIEGLEEEVRLHDPYIALDGKEDGLYFYRRIIQDAGRYMNPGGWLLFETGHDQKTEVCRLLEDAGFSRVQGKKDLAGLDRVVMGMYNK